MFKFICLFESKLYTRTHTHTFDPLFDFPGMTPMNRAVKAPIQEPGAAFGSVTQVSEAKMLGSLALFFRSGEARTQTDNQMGCQCHRQPLYPLPHNANPELEFSGKCFK